MDRKEEILQTFSDINYAYNNCTKYDTLKRMLDELTEPCDDCISRQATVERLCKVAEFMDEKRKGLGSPYVMAALFIQDNKDEFPSVTPKVEECEDAISRKAVSDAMYELCGEGSLKDNPWRDNPHIDSIICAIEDLPPVTPKQKMGRWISSVNDNTCSICGEHSLTYWKSKFCPNCGAKMGESEGK